MFVNFSGGAQTGAPYVRLNKKPKRPPSSEPPMTSASAVSRMISEAGLSSLVHRPRDLFWGTVEARFVDPGNVPANQNVVRLLRSKGYVVKTSSTSIRVRKWSPPAARK